MRPIKFAILLPVAQLVIAGILLQWAKHAPFSHSGIDTPYVPTARMICYGLSAPADRLRMLDSLLTSRLTPSWTLMGFYFDEWLFLIGVIAVWYFVGRKIDSYRLSNVETPQETSRSALFFNGLVFLFGLYLLLVTIINFGSPLRSPRGGNLVGSIVETVLFFAWSLFLILTPGRRLRKFVRSSS
jgi:hypothetical protein